MQKKYTLIKNARLIDHSLSSLQNCSILIENDEKGQSRIVEIGRVRIDGIDPTGLFIYDAKSHYVSAGFVDLCTHAREPGYMSAETLKSASLAACAGGFTTFLTTPDTSPRPDDPSIIKYVVSNSLSASCKVLPCACAATGKDESQLCDIVSLMENGAAAVSCTSYTPPDILLKAMKICAEHSYPFIIKCSEPVQNGYLDYLPKIKEDVATATAVVLAAESGCPIHISCLSSARSVDIVRRAKDAGVKITCGTCPQYFIFEEHDILFFGNNLKLMPPLGTAEDKNAITEGIKDGTIDCISSDHSPQPEALKNKSPKEAACGMISLQTLFPASYTHLVSRGVISLQRLVEMIAYNPARVLHREGELKVASRADITVFSASGRDTHEILRADNKSASYNSPFFGQTLCGTVIKTFFDRY